MDASSARALHHGGGGVALIDGVVMDYMYGMLQTGLSGYRW